MKQLYVAAAAAALFATPALAGSLESMYDNTVVITNTKGESYSSHVEKDGTYKATMADGKVVTGKWEVKNGQFCGTPDAVEGQPAPVQSCGEFVDNKNVGDKWEQKNAAGETITVEIKAGR